MDLKNLYIIENYCLTRFIGNLNKLIACKHIDNRYLYRSKAYEDLETTGEVNNFTKAINPGLLRLVAQKINFHDYSTAKDIYNRLLLNSTVLNTNN